MNKNLKTKKDIYNNRISNIDNTYNNQKNYFKKLYANKNYIINDIIDDFILGPYEYEINKLKYGIINIDSNEINAIYKSNKNLYAIKSITKGDQIIIK